MITDWSQNKITPPVDQLSLICDPREKTWMWSKVRSSCSRSPKIQSVQWSSFPRFEDEMGIISFRNFQNEIWKSRWSKVEFGGFQEHMRVGYKISIISITESLFQKQVYITLLMVAPWEFPAEKPPRTKDSDLQWKIRVEVNHSRRKFRWSSIEVAVNHSRRKFRWSTIQRFPSFLNGLF